MTTLPAIPDKVLALLPRLASDADGEVIATARLIGRQLSVAGSDWHDLVARLKSSPLHQSDGEPRTWRDVAMWCARFAQHLTPKEARFVRDMANKLILDSNPTEKQAAWLRAIFAHLKEATK